MNQNTRKIATVPLIRARNRKHRRRYLSISLHYDLDGTRSIVCHAFRRSSRCTPPQILLYHLSDLDLKHIAILLEQLFRSSLKFPEETIRKTLREHRLVPTRRRCARCIAQNSQETLPPSNGAHSLRNRDSVPRSRCRSAKGHKKTSLLRSRTCLHATALAPSHVRRTLCANTTS